MKCPECNTEVDSKLRNCPECGAPMPHGNQPKGNEPADDLRLGKGMMAFIVIGLAALIVISVAHYFNHVNDPEYFRTLIEPDTTIADRELVRLETTAPPDTIKRDSIEKAEKKEAEQVFNSIRKRPVEEQAEEETPSAEPSESSEAAPSAESASPAPESAPAPTPKIEAIE